MEAGGVSGVVVNSEEVETAEGATAEGADWEAEVGAEAGKDSAAAEQEFKVQVSVVFGVYILCFKAQDVVEFGEKSLERFRLGCTRIRDCSLRLRVQGSDLMI
jgi:hypothetical protein